jgi:hypothetical protein
MYTKLASAVVVVLLSSGLAADPPPWPPHAQRTGEYPIEHWTDRLAYEIDHLQEDLHYERVPRNLIRQVDRAARAVAHFQEVLRSTTDAEHLARDFREMDRQVHQLTEELTQSGDSWLVRQSSRIRYADEQLHYLVRGGTISDPGHDAPELLARHAQVLDGQARQLVRLVERSGYAGGNGELTRALHQFVDQAEQFHRAVHQGERGRRLANDFQNLDRTWHWIVDQLNRSEHEFSVLRTAQRVNRVHNQLHDMVIGGEHRHAGPEERTARRPQLEFEIPGIGRFQLR